MGDVGIAAFAELALVTLGSNLIGPPDQAEIGPGPVSQQRVVESRDGVMVVYSYGGELAVHTGKVSRTVDVG